MDEGGGVDADEGDEGSEIEEFGALLERHEEGAEEGDGSEEEDVVARDVGGRADGAEETFGEGVGSTHAVE